MAVSSASQRAARLRRQSRGTSIRMPFFPPPSWGRASQPGDRVYVSDAAGHEVTFSVTALQVEPLDGFPTLRVFGPAKGRLLVTATLV